MPTFERSAALTALAEEAFDVVVIGAGMTGTGAALDAASRGLSVALLDAGDFANGTSSKSSKMVHGGLRYLQQRDFRLVRENLRERQRLLNNAPHLVRPLPFLIPLWAASPLAGRALTRGYSTALGLYELSGAWRIGERHRRVSATEARAHLPSLRPDSLQGGFLYLDARGDDARVALTLARSAVDHGAWAANYVRVTGFDRDDLGRVRRVRARNELDQSEFTISTRCVINATGVWADEILAMGEHVESQAIVPAKGVHVSVPRERLATDVAAVLPVPGDRRSIFVVPFEDAPYTFIGTTDTAYDDELDEPLARPEDVTYLLEAVNAATSAALTIEDVTGVWAGLRPLLRPRRGEDPSTRTADLSRRHRVSDPGDGIIHVTGGKWTTYRQMAEDSVNALAPYLGRVGPVRTKALALHGSSRWRPRGDLATHLHQRFGDDARAVLDLIDADPGLADHPFEGLDYVLAEFVYAAEREMVTSLIDLLCRRSRAHLIDARATGAGAPRVAAAVAPALGWDDAQRDVQVAAYRSLRQREFEAAGLVL